MLRKLRARAQDEKGFTLIELLVVILIIGILAAIALPAFLNQREKAHDTEAKSNVRTAQTAMETYYVDNQKYTGGDVAALTTIEPALKNANVLTAVPDAAGTGYTVSSKSRGTEGVTYSIRNVAGTITRLCDKVGKGGCKAADAANGGNQW